MIGILLNHTVFEQDIRELLMAFFPGEAFVYERTEDALFYVEGNFNEDQTSYCLSLTEGRQPELLRRKPVSGTETGAVEGEESSRLSEPIVVDLKDHVGTKNKIKRRLYVLLKQITGKSLPWGTLTGIRPVKLAMAGLEAGEAEASIVSRLKDTYFTSDEKIHLCIDTAKTEQRLLKAIDYEHGYSLYVGVPFCPTTCLYCSFTSYPVSKWKGRIHLYLETLYREMDYVAEKMKGRSLDTVYIGGGTPTALSAEQLDGLLSRMETTFQISGALEFTVEAGRPDSITEEKLKVLKGHGVSRISVNPQTMQQKTLDLIGRHHTVEMVSECFALARKNGFDNINMDLIIGLPGESLDDVRDTLEQIRALSPDSLTVHALALKRASRLNLMKAQYEGMSTANPQAMVDLAAAFAKEMGMEPYYLYRQKNIAGNFENVGYALPGKECIYNILIMEEKQTIVACGPGTTTKVIYPSENRIERAENVKDVDLYLTKIGEMIERKEKLLAKLEKPAKINS